MTPTKESIKAWLEAHPDRDRHWLAAKCEVEKRTVDNWLSSPQNIPGKALLIIEGLMRADRETDRAKQPVPPMTVVLEVPPQTFDDYNRAATNAGMIIREWAVEVLNQAARRDAERGAVKYPSARDEKARLAMVAEEPEEKRRTGA